MMAAISEIDPRQFRQALGAFTTGVTVVTACGADGTDVGLTANSFNSVSLEPPMVLWSLGKSSSNLHHFMAAEHFAVHILAADQQTVSDGFAKKGTDRFAGLEFARGHGDVPLLEGCATRLECRTTHRYEGGDHIIFVGEVLSFDASDRRPLVFHSGKYGLVLNKPVDLDEPPAIGDDWLGFLLARAFYQMHLPLRGHVERQGLSDVHYNILSVLSMGDDRTMQDVAELVAITGHRPPEAAFHTLAAKGLIAIDADERISFTPSGRDFAVSLLAAGKSIEEDVERGLDAQEARLLKILLKRVIGQTHAVLPEAWRQENFWRQNNIRGAAAADLTIHEGASQ
ncbi:MAG: flavin reductase [Paracoccus sp. (in: a-proteobacteria)]|nr:flavin reductase [Paracoccus sp. (in: a-proteobacteria)]